jgi:ABC-type nitrate/sulfonate/bicarbonate transport system substrate-binding protein
MLDYAHRRLADRAIGEVARAVYPAEKFEFDRIIKNDLGEMWQIGSNQTGTFASGERSAKEASIIQQNFQRRIGQEQDKVTRLFVGIAKVLAGHLAIYGSFALPDDIGQNRALLANSFIYTVRADGTVRLDAEQRIEQLLKALNVTAQSGYVNPKPIITEIWELSGVDPAKVEIVNMAPNLQEQMLLQGQVDVSAVFTATSYMNLVAQKLDPDKDFRWIYFADSGLDLYSNGIMVSAKLAREKPDAVKGLVRAIARAMREAVADPGAAIELLAVKEPLINKDIEKRRLVYVVKSLIATPEAAELGVGDIKDTRMAEAIATIVAAYELPKTPAVGEVFNRSFLPPKGDRVLPATGN